MSLQNSTEDQNLLRAEEGLEFNSSLDAKIGFRSSKLGHLPREITLLILQIYKNSRNVFFIKSSKLKQYKYRTVKILLLIIKFMRKESYTILLVK